MTVWFRLLPLTPFVRCDTICQMANSLQLHVLPEHKSHLSSDLDGFVELIPALYYAVNRVFEDSTAPSFSKKVGVVLWTLGSSTTSDSVGRYLTTAELVAQFREWFVVSEKSAGPEVSRAKKELLDGGYIMVVGGNDHIHLTTRGEDALLDLRAKARETLRATLVNVHPDDRAQLLEIATRLIIAQKLQPASQLQESFAFVQEQASA
jgi:hypothetical protein